MNSIFHSIPIREIGGYLFYVIDGQLRPVSKEPMTWEQFCKKIDEVNKAKQTAAGDAAKEGA